MLYCQLSIKKDIMCSILVGLIRSFDAIQEKPGDCFPSRQLVLSNIPTINRISNHSLITESGILLCTIVWYIPEHSDNTSKALQWLWSSRFCPEVMKSNCWCTFFLHSLTFFFCYYSIWFHFGILEGIHIHSTLSKSIPEDNNSLRKK